jgi:acetyl esterase/lipase
MPPKFRPSDLGPPGKPPGDQASRGRRVGLMAGLAALLTPLLQACSPLRIINALAPSDTHRDTPDQAYGPHPRQRLDIYQPTAATAAATTTAAPHATGGAPLVVFFYGGSWTTGDRADYLFVGEALASRGVVTLVADYRLSPEVRYPVFLQDCALAVRWAFDNAQRLGASPQRVHIVGHSAGAYNAAMLALDARWLNAVGLAPAQLAGWVGIAGPYDFLPIGVPEVQVAFEWPNTPPESQPLLHAQRLPQASASARALTPSALLLAPRDDNLVNTQRSTVGLGQRLRDAGVDAQTVLLDNVSHTTIIGAMARPLRMLAPVLDKVAGFINR